MASRSRPLGYRYRVLQSPQPSQYHPTQHSLRLGHPTPGKLWPAHRNIDCPPYPVLTRLRILTVRILGMCRRELAVCMALSADGARVLRLVIARGLRLTAGGILLGAATGFAQTRLLANLLFQVSPDDPVAFGSAMAAMTIIACTACLLPAWRATRIDPTQVLRD